MLSAAMPVLPLGPGGSLVSRLGLGLAALAVGSLPPLDLAEPPGAYRASRAARPWG
jgi:hypothetical protein